MVLRAVLGCAYRNASKPSPADFKQAKAGQGGAAGKAGGKAADGSSENTSSNAAAKPHPSAGGAAAAAAAAALKPRPAGAAAETLPSGGVQGKKPPVGGPPQTPAADPLDSLNPISNLDGRFSATGGGLGGLDQGEGGKAGATRGAGRQLSFEDSVESSAPPKGAARDLMDEPMTNPQDSFPGE